MKAFKQRHLELEEENQQLKRQLGATVPQAGASSPKGAKTSARGLAKKKSGFADYENTLNEMRQIMRWWFPHSNISNNLTNHIIYQTKESHILCFWFM